jgi:hypothetical protein
MASTPTGAALTTAHRAQQLAVQAGSIDNLVLLWRAVDVTRLGDTIDVFAQAAALLAARGFDDSAASSANYYSLFRRVEIGTGLAVPLASRPPLAVLASDIRGAALSGILKARRAGMDVGRASERGLVRAIGTLGKLVLSGGRMTIVEAVKTDRRALGWMRATSGDPCTFCRMLASRGATYKSEKSADFQPHDHCGCAPEPLYEDDDTTLGAAGRGEQFADEWSKAQSWARANGTMSAGTSNNALNNYRRYLAAGEPTAGNAGTEDSGQ